MGPNKPGMTGKGFSVTSVRLALLLAVAVATRVWQFGNPVLFVDDQFYLLIGDRMWGGALPYVDIWDRKPVGLFLLYAAIRALPGDGVLAYQLVATLFAAATAWVVARLAGLLTGAAGATLAGVAYLAFLGVFGGDGGQAPVFYNLFVALAALSVVRAREEPARAFRFGCGAMALAGVAIQVKYTALFEGVFFGLALMWQARRDPRMPAMALAWAAIALAPTALAFGFYAASGHAEAFWFANFTSIFARGGDGAAGGLGRLATMAAKLLPFVIAIAIGLRARSPVARLLAGWALSAVLGVLIFGTWWDHYALPLLAPLAVLAAPALPRWRGAVAVLVIGAGIVLSARAIVRHREGRGDGTLVRNVAAFVRPRLHGRCLFIYDGDPWLYAMTGSCLPTTRPFPDHLDNWREDRATGIDAVAEVRRIMATRPPVVLAVAMPEAKTNQRTWREMQRQLAAHYRLARAWPIPDGRQLAFVPR